MPRSPSLTGAEALAVSAAAMPAATIVAAYLLDRAGLSFPPFALLFVFAGAGAGAFWLVRHEVEWRVDEAIALAAIVTATFAWLMWIAAPFFLPLGSGSDLTHHLLLIHYVEDRWRLVHDTGAERFLGEMTGYTPGSHILAAAAGAWTGTNGFRALHPVVSAAVALKTGFVFLIALRAIGPAPSAHELSARAARLLFACLAVVLLFASEVYFLRSFVENSFVAQVVSELFAVVMWWSLVVWDRRATWLAPGIFGVAGAAAFLTWPVWIGPPVVVAVALALLLWQRPVAERASHLALAAAPMALVAALYFAARSGGLGMAGTGGAAPWPTVSSYGPWFLALSGVGFVVAMTRREARTVALLAVAIGLQSAALYVVAMRGGADAPYLALKMFYLLLYPQAVAAALAVSAAWRAGLAAFEAASNRARGFPRFAGWRGPIEAALVLLIVMRVGAIVARPLRGAPRSLTVLKHPAVSAPLERAGRWARANVPPDCVEYLVDHDGTSYWLHLAVLGNPRLTARSMDSDTFKPDLAIVRWLTPGGLPYAIADLPALPRGVRDELDIVRQFDTAAVVKRRGPSTCAPER